MPKAVVLQTDDEPPTNLSAEAYSAWTGKGTSVVGPMIHGRWLDHIQMFGGAGGPRPRPRRPSSVTLKEHLDSTQVEAMLKVETPWKLIVRKTDDDLYVIDRSKLESAWAQDASGTVRVELDRLSVGEKAAYDAAKEQFEPKAGIKRLQAGLGAPVTNIALLAAVGTGGIVGVNKFGDKAIEWTLPLYLAVFFGVVSVLLSFLLNSLVRRRTVNLARLDLLENDAAASRRPAVLTNAVILLFAAAIAVSCGPS